MNKERYEPANLEEVVRGDRKSHTVSSSASKGVVNEVAGDAALSEKRYQEALNHYQASGGKSWRLKRKIGYCAYMLHDYARCAAVLESAGERGDALLLCLLIECTEVIERDNFGPNGKLDSLAKTLLGLPSPKAYYFEVGCRFILDASERLERLSVGFALYPANAVLRRLYIGLALTRGYPDEELLSHVHDAIEDPESTILDRWQGVLAMRAAGRYSDALDMLAAVCESATETARSSLAVVRGDLLALLGDADRAAALFRGLLLEAHAEELFDECSLAASRGLLSIMAQQRNMDGLEPAADSFVSAFCSAGTLSILEQINPIDPDPIRVDFDGSTVTYMPSLGLLEYQELIVCAVENADTRAVIKVLFAQHRDTDTETGTSLILSAGRESDTPFIQREFGWELMDAGEYRAAGRAFALLETARLLESSDEWYPNDADSMFDDAPFDCAGAVDQFAQGMIDQLISSLDAEPGPTAMGAYEVVTAYLRAPLLKYKLYSLLHQVMDAVLSAANSASEKVSGQLWFDYGLACDFVEKRELAISSYEACLEVFPAHAAAQSNLLRLLPSASQARKRAVILHDIQTMAQGRPPSTIAEMSLTEAVYLVALYRICEGGEQDMILHPFAASEIPFSPTLEMRGPLFRLLRTGLLRISPNSPIEAFHLSADQTRVESYVLGDLYWQLDVSTMSRIIEIEEACLSGNWPSAWREQVPALAHELARYECLAYLRHCADDRSLPLPTGEKTMLMIDNALATYSVAQAYCIFWQGAAAASDFKQRKSVSALHAGNTIVGNCQRRLDSARTQNWDIKSYTRTRDVSRSQISITLHDTFLAIGEKAFTTPLKELFVFT